MEGVVFYFNWEVELMEWLQSFASPLLINIISFFSVFGEEIMLIMLMGFFYWGYNKKIGRNLGITTTVALMVGPLIKNVALRRRPYFDNENINCLRIVDKKADIYDVAAQGYSFPSMHSTNAMALYGGLAKNLKKKALYFVVAFLIFMVGFSRVFVGVHYPTDVLAGWSIGLVAIIVIDFLEKKISNYLILAAIFAALAFPGWFYCTSNDYFTVYGLMVGMLLGFWFEDTFVKFENTKSVFKIILRVILGAISFVIVSNILKVPFSKEMLAESTFIAHFIRTVRYFIATFVVTGVYPMSFKLFTKK